MVKKIILILILFASIAQADIWDENPPFCQTETYASVTQTVGVGVAIPSATYYLSLKIWPEKIQDYRFIRLGAIHIVTGILAMQLMKYESWHDGDPAYTNVILILPVSFIGNMLADLMKNGLQNDLPKN